MQKIDLLFDKFTSSHKCIGFHGSRKINLLFALGLMCEEKNGVRVRHCIEGKFKMKLYNFSKREKVGTVFPSL